MPVADWLFYYLKRIFKLMLRDNILATLAYYDVLDLPLKAEEVLRYLVKLENQNSEMVGFPGSETSESGRAAESKQSEVLLPGLPDIKKTLDQLILDRIVDVDEKFYFLLGRDHLFPLRKKKTAISTKKWVRVRRVIWWLKFVPYVEAVFASGTLAMNNCDELSDLDILVVARHGRIWTTRFIVTGIMSLLGVRRRWDHIIAPDKICLNHYITDKSLKIPFENIYNAQTYAHLKPILLKSQKTISDFYKANGWLGKYLQSFQPNSIFFDTMMYQRNMVVGLWEWVLNSRLGNWLEKKLKQYQIQRIEKNPLSQSANRRKKGHIVFNDEMLAFHPDSPEGEIIKKYQERLGEIKTG